MKRKRKVLDYRSCWIDADVIISIFLVAFYSQLLQEWIPMLEIYVQDSGEVSYHDSLVLGQHYGQCLTFAFPPSGTRNKYPICETVLRVLYLMGVL